MIETAPRRPTAAATRAAVAVTKARRLSPRLRKLVLAAHVLVAVGWFGIVVAKLVLAVTAVTTRDQEIPGAAYVFMQVLDRAIFPPAALGTLLTGVILSVGTAWGLFQHYWIVAKLVLTLLVILSGVLFVGAWVQQATATASGPAADIVTRSDVGPASMRLVYASLAHLLMLGAATVISVYKPWGRIRPDRHDSVRRSAPTSTNQTA